MVMEHRSYIDLLKAGDCKMLQKKLSDSLDKRQNEVPYKVSTYLDDGTR
jgi:hypothetical protein